MASVTSPSPTIEYDYDYYANITWYDWYDYYANITWYDWYDYYDNITWYDFDYYAPPPLPSPTTDYYNDTVPYVHNPPPRCINDPWCITQLVIRVIIFLLGVVGNGLVIWVTGFKMKQKTVTTTWYLSLAVSDFLYCTMLPFTFHLAATGSWIFGLFMCKFIYFVLYLNMFSSIFLMVVISVDRCVSVVFVFWARSNRTLKRATLTVVVAWLLAMALSIPYLVGRDIETDNNQVTYCYDNYEMLPGSSTGVPVFHFVLGFVFPLVIIIVCYSIIIVRLGNNRTAKPFRVMTAVIVTFVLCWLPFHIVMLLYINPNPTHYTFIHIGLVISVILLGANSCINPFLYAFMGKVGKQKRRSSFKKIISKI